MYEEINLPRPATEFVLCIFSLRNIFKTLLRNKNKGSILSSLTTQ